MTRFMEVHDRAKYQFFFWFHTLCKNYVIETFLLVSSSMKSKQPLWFVHRRSRSKSYRNKRSLSVSKQFFSIDIIVIKRNSFCPALWHALDTELWEIRRVVSKLRRKVTHNSQSSLAWRQCKQTYNDHMIQINHCVINTLFSPDQQHFSEMNFTY